MDERVALRGFRRIKQDLGDESLTVRSIDSYQIDAKNMAGILFGTDSDHYKTICDAEKLSTGIKLEILLEEIELIIKELEDTTTIGPVSKSSQMINSSNNLTSKGNDKVFIVHGRDDSTKELTAQFLKELGLEPIILHEQPNKGRTIIEKFEDHSSGVKYAVILLTPDDVGGLRSDTSELSPRARQNVVFEMGHFFGKLGRGKVCALLSNDVEPPSDIDGIMYIPLDQGVKWKASLFRELKAAGLKIDTWIDPRIEETAKALYKTAIGHSLGRMEDKPWAELDENEKNAYRLNASTALEIYLRA